jgi:limonene-1,2-epoxide hydrolase
MTANEDIVLSFIESWENHDSLRDGYANYMAEDCLWENTGLKPIVGRDAVLALVDRSIETWGRYTVHTTCHHVAVTGDLVFVERHDLVNDENGSHLYEMPIVGVFEVIDGKIKRWSDYYDPKPMFASINQAAARKAATND